MPLRQVESVEVPVEARAEVSDGQATENHEEQNQGRHQQDHVVMEQRREETEEENRPHCTCFIDLVLIKLAQSLVSHK